METYLVIAIATAVVVALVVAFAMQSARRRRREIEPPPPAERLEEKAPAPGVTEVEAKAPEPVEPPAPVAPVPAAPDLSGRLARTREAFLSGLGGLFGRQASKGFTQTEWDEMEEALLGADVGVATSSRLIDGVRAKISSANGKSLRHLIREECAGLLDEARPNPAVTDPKPLVISIVGVNGVGKTTTVGKLAHRFIASGKSVLLAAADTFRAGAASQLKIWADRVGAEIVSGREGGDPGAVAFDAVNAGKSRGTDIVLLDTAGRLHTKSNLMDELKKVHRVVKKVIPEAPHETWLVIDGTLGQNSVRQAAEFHQALDLTGVIVTKLDGTAKGGAILAVAAELKLPVKFIGIGESASDLVDFEPDSFLEAVLGTA